jgi:hypothetical protein
MMGFTPLAWMATMACGAAAAYGIYAPETTARWVPAAGGIAHQLHIWICRVVLRENES